MPDQEIYELDPLFAEVQLSHVFPDGKTFVDCLPKYSTGDIYEKYIRQKNDPGFDLRDFVMDNFDPPVPHSTGYASDTSKPVEDNIEALWNVLTHPPDKKSGSLIPLPYPYIVPGGRFGEIYYWDSYFTMLGLKASGKNEMVENMVRNFSYLIDTVDHIPNGNRSYYLTRSQPPFYSLMIQLLAEIKGNGEIVNYLPQLEKEYRFWTKGNNQAFESGSARCHSVKMPGGELLNRYWDESDSPRPESFREDILLSQQSNQKPSELFRHLRAGAESGWDFSSRWFYDENSFATICTTDIVPVDLNCLLWNLEKTIAKAYELKELQPRAQHYNAEAERRREAIQHYLWNNDAGFFVDYNFARTAQNKMLTLAGISPLFFNIASPHQAEKMVQVIEKKFLMPGGVVTTLKNTGQQWDSPNGWAPLQWMAIIGLENYGYKELAHEIAHRWIKLNTDVFLRTGKLMEKYNVVNIDLEAGGGEYEGQDGFGWTNGVLLALIMKYGHT